MTDNPTNFGTKKKNKQADADAEKKPPKSMLGPSNKMDFQYAAQESMWDKTGLIGALGGAEYGKPSEDQPEAPLWLLTFTDIMALMLTFFVLLYSMSVPRVDLWEDLTREASRAITFEEAMARFSGENVDLSIEKISSNRALDLTYLSRLLTAQLEKNEKFDSVLIFQGQDKLVISLPSDLLFDSASAELNTEGKRAIFSLSNILNKIRNRIEVIGHADPAPISGGAYASNWELSLARAMSVSGSLSASGYQRDITARGLSSARYDELDPALTEEKRLSLSRRVDIVVMEDDGRQRQMLSIDN